VEDSRLFREDPWLRELGWIRQGEMMTREYLDYIITEKNYGVELAAESLHYIEEGQPKIETADYSDLYDTFFRTVVKARLSRGAAKAYFSYRLWFGDVRARSQELLDLFWEGIDEMNEMSDIVRKSFGDSPQGGWTWEEDLETVSEYTGWMTKSGWEAYGGRPIVARKYQ
jgi:hypothetical protein